MNIVHARNLVCPLDGTVLSVNGKQLICTNGHSFDIARQSYFNLLPVQYKKSKDPGDSKAMVVARSAFLSGGYYSKIAQKLASLSQTYLPGLQNICLLDAGCGEGYFLEQLMQHFVKLNHTGQISLIGLDISKWAIITASKRTKNITWIVGTNKKIPIAPKTLDMIHCHFGFPNYDEFDKLLKPGGKIIITEVKSDHLIELRKTIYPLIKSSRSKPISENMNFNLVEAHSLNYKIRDLPQQDISNLLTMTPHLYRAPSVGKKAAAKLDNMTMTVDVTFRVLQKPESNKPTDI